MDKRRMCPQCRAFITTDDKVCPYCDAKVGPRAIDVRSPADLLGGLIPQAGFVTALILLINGGLYAATALYSMNSGEGRGVLDIDGLTLFRFGAKFRAAIRAGEWWRLVTAGFLHGGVFHILMNSWALVDLGRQVEELYGHSRMYVFYFVATVAGFVASTWWSNTLSIGASAGIFGLIGVMIAFGSEHKGGLGSTVRGFYIRWAVYGLLIGLLPMFRVDNAAHLGGLAGGFLIARVAGTPRLDQQNPVEKLWMGAAWVTAAATAYCFVRMYLSFSNPTL